VVNGAGTPHPNGWQIETNTGMSIVIPAWRLMGLLNRPELVMQRKKKDAEYGLNPEARHKTIRAAEPEPEPDDEETPPRLDVETPETFTKESYQDALKRASRKVSESQDSDK
jgi:hypothetical protein